MTKEKMNLPFGFTNFNPEGLENGKKLKMDFYLLLGHCR